jgi:hypothetical protein
MFRTCICVRHCALLLLSFAPLNALSSVARGAFNEFSIGGDTTAASIQTTVDNFRAALGDPNNGNNPGPLASGRREINWDGGGAVSSTASGATLTAFTNTRGATMTTPGTGFLQTPVADAAFTALNPAYATTFGAFSPQRIFTPLGSNITDVTFSLPGSNGATPATVSGFGAVFSEVDLLGSTTIQFFDFGNNSLGTFNVPAATGSPTAPGRGLSFFGAIANASERIARVRITSGSAALGPNDTNGNPDDLVVMDDFLYNEPIAIPEPATLALAMASLVALAASSRRP